MFPDPNLKGEGEFVSGSGLGSIGIDESVLRHSADGCFPIQANMNLDQAAFAIFKELCARSGCEDEDFIALAQRSYKAARCFGLVKGSKEVLEKGI